MAQIFATHTEELAHLEKLGFPINTLNQKADTLEQIWQIQADLEKEREGLNYPIDGLVVKLNDNQLVEKLGVVGKTKRGWSAIKFAATEVSTKVLGITWQIGRTGKLTPVAELEPVQLAGTVVKRATLHNYKNLVDLDVEIGDLVIIRKAGDIIPEVLQVIKI
jgi:DNA ligase (NAD+)